MNPVLADELTQTEESLPYSENYSGAMLLNADGTQLRVGHSEGNAVGRRDSISNIELFHSVPTAGNEIWFYDLRLILDNSAQFGGNMGVGYRRYLDEWDRIIGASLWYDLDDTNRRSFQQFGLSLETYGENCDARANFYLPVGDTEKTFAYSNLEGRFQGNSLLLDRYRYDEAAMTGLDAEIGTPLPGELGEAYNIRAYAGLYHYAADGGPDILGVSGRLEGRVRPDLSLRVAITNDEEFDTNIVFGATWYLPYGGRRANDIAPTMTTYDRLEERVYRNYTIAVTDTKNLETYVDSATAGGIFHVDSSAAPGGDGSIESPFQTLVGVEAAAPTDAIIFAHADSVFDTESIVLQSGQRLLGEGIAHYVDTERFGNVLLPRATTGTLLPEILDAPGIAVGLADDSEASGFTITHADGTAIYADGVSGDVRVAHNTIDSDTGDGVNILNSTASFSFEGTSIDGNGNGDGFVIANGAPTISFDGDISNLNGGRSISVSNTTGGSVAFSGAVDGSSDLGILIDEVGGDVSIANVDSSNSNSNGIRVSNSSGAITFENVTIDDPSSTAISMNDNTGLVTFTGNNRVDTSGSAAIDITDTALDAMFDSISVNGSPGDGISLADTTGSFTVGADAMYSGAGGTIRNATGNGISLTNAENVSLNFMRINASAGNDGIEIATTGAADSTIELANIRVMGAANEGIELNADGTGTLNVVITDSSIVATNDALNAATSAAGGSLELALSGTTLRSTDRAGANLDGSFGGTLTVTDFSGNTVLGNATGNGGVLADTVTFDADTQTAGIQQVDGGDTTIGTLANRVSGDGLRLDQVIGDLAFGDLVIANDGGTGLFVRNNAPDDFSLANTGGVIDTTNGTAVDVDPVVLDMRIASISSVDSRSYGISFDEIRGSFTVTGTTTIDNAADAGIRIANVADAASVFDFGTVNITNGNDYGIQIDNVAGTLTFADTTIGEPLTGANSGIQMVGSSASVTFDSVDITDGGVELLNSTGSFAASGGSIVNGIGRAIDITMGSVDATFTDMAISSVGGGAAVTVGNGLPLNGGSLTIDGASTVSADDLTAGMAGVAVNANNSDFTLDISSVAVEGDGTGGTGVAVSNLGAGGSATFGSVTIEDVETGVALQDSAGSFTFESISVTGATTGIALDDLSGSFAVGSGGAVPGDGGSLNDITDDGIAMNNVANASAGFMNIDVGAGNNAVAAVLSGTNTGILSLTNNDIAGAGAEGVNLNNSGTGTFSITANDNSITSTGDSFNTVLSNAGGSLGLNLNDNDASGAYVLDNGAGGTFQLGGTLGQGSTFTGGDNGNVANNGNTTSGGAPSVGALGDIEIVDPASIPLP